MRWLKFGGVIFLFFVVLLTGFLFLSKKRGVYFRCRFFNCPKVVLIDSTDRAQVTWNPDGAGPEGVQKALLRVAAELNRTTVEQIRQDLEQGKQVLCPVTHYKFDDKGNLVYTQPVDDEWDLSKPVEIKFVDNNWGGGRSSGRRIVIDVVDGSLVLKIWTRIDEQVLNNEWRGTTSVLEALWRVLLKGTQSSEDPLRVERMSVIRESLMGFRKPIIIIGKQ